MARNPTYVNGNNALPQDQEGQPVEGLLDIGTGNIVAKRATNVSYITVNGKKIYYGDQAVGSSSSTDVVASGTISAAQPAIGTPVANATVALALGAGQATWLIEIVGPISSGTTLVFDQTEDAVPTWLAAVGYDATITNPPAITTVSGPLASGTAFSIRGIASGLQQIRVRANALHAGDSFTVRLIGSLGSLNVASGNGSATIADGADVAQGTTTQTKATDGTTTSWTVIQLLKGIFDKLLNSIAVTGSVTTSGTVTEANSAASKTDLDNILTQVTNHTETNSAAIDTQVTNLNTVEGLTSDAAVTGDNTGTVSAKLRGLSKMLFDMWDSTNHWLQVRVMNAVTLGQATMSASQPVVISSDQTSIPVKGSYTEVIGTGAAVTGVNTDLYAAMDVSAYKWLAFQITGTFTATLTFQASNDGANWIAVSMNNIATNSSGNAGSATASTNVLFTSPVQFRWFRVRCTAWTSNASLASIMELYTEAPGGYGFAFIQAIQNGTWTVQPGNTANTTAWKVDGSAVTQPVSATSLPLPAGAASEVGHLATIDTSTAASKTDLDLMVPGVQGWIAPTGTGTVTTDDSLTFASQVRKVMLYNASANPIPIEFDQTSAATSFPMPPGAMWFIEDIRTTVVHVFPSVTLPINTTSGLYIKGWT